MENSNRSIDMKINALALKMANELEGKACLIENIQLWKSSDIYKAFYDVLEPFLNKLLEDHKDRVEDEKNAFNEVVLAYEQKLKEKDRIIDNLLNAKK